MWEEWTTGCEVARVRADVVAVEGDVDVADRDGGVGELAEDRVQAAGEQGAPSVDADDRQSVRLRVLLGDLVGDPPQRPPQVVALEHDLLAHSGAPSRPLRTWLKDGLNVAAAKAGMGGPLLAKWGGSSRAYPSPPASLAPLGTSTGSPRSANGTSTTSKSRGATVGG